MKLESNILHEQGGELGCVHGLGKDVCVCVSCLEFSTSMCTSAPPGSRLLLLLARNNFNSVKGIVECVGIDWLEESVFCSNLSSDIRFVVHF